MELLYRADSTRRQRILRAVYECGVFQSLREKLRCKEIWVVGADKWRNPDDDLPKDFEANRAENYAKLCKPLDPKRFTAELMEELDAELSALNDAFGGKGPALAEDRRTTQRRGDPPDPVGPGARTAAPAPAEDGDQSAVGRGPADGHADGDRAAHRLPERLHPAGTQNHLDAQVLFERLLLLIYAYGTGAEQELGMLCLHILQSCLGLINTLMIQDTLALPEWQDMLTDADRRGLTPIFHSNMTPYGEIQLRTDRRLDLTDLPKTGR